MRLWTDIKERSACLLMGVVTYRDIFEKAALKPGRFVALSDACTPVARYFHRRISSEIHAHPVLFIHVPKNGGTSIRKALYTSDCNHTTARYYDFVSPHLLDDKESFAILRDPFDRFLSGYNFLTSAGGEDVGIDQRFLRRLRAIKTVDQYLECLERSQDDWLKFDNFGRPQWWYIVDNDNRIRVRNLFLLGTHDRELEDFFAGIGISTPPRRNKTIWTVHALTQQQRARVRRLYDWDFRIVERLRDGRCPPSQLYGATLPELV